MSKPFKMPQLNEVTLVGRLTMEPDLRYTPSGAAVLGLRIACDRFWRDKTSNESKKETSYFNCNVWGKAAEYHGKTLKKGMAVLVCGELRSRSWDDNKSGEKRYAVDIVAQRVSALEWESEKDGSPSGDHGTNEEPDTPNDQLSDIPF